MQNLESSLSQKGVELDRTTEEKKDLERQIQEKEHLLTEAERDKEGSNTQRVSN